MQTECDLAVIGAGPSGMAAAVQAAKLGLSTVLLDEQGELGGQIYRSIENVRLKRPDMLGRLGSDYARGAELVDALCGSGVDCRRGAVVWNIGRDLVVNYSAGGGSHALAPRHVLIATGALERPVPIPGWTLPGVITVGGLQLLLKAHGLVPDGRVVLAGSGPLLLLLAAQYLAVGVKPAAIVETVPWSRYVAAVPRLLPALCAREYLHKGLMMLYQIRAAGVPFHRGASGLKIDGETRARALAFVRRGRTHRIAADLIALHQGVVPNQQVTRLLGCEHDWDGAQRCFRPRLDPWFMTTVEGVSVAGDSAGIGGARAAEMRGRLATLGIAARLGRVSTAERDRRGAADRAALASDLAVRPFLDTLYAPPDDVLRPSDDVLICRCEEVTAGRVREAVRLGCPGPNQAKSFLRCGMGPCQGRICGLPVTEVIARERGVSPATVDYYRIRPPLKPLTLGELAALDVAREREGVA